MARIGTVEVDARTGAGMHVYRAAKGIERDVATIAALKEHGLLPKDKALQNRLQRVLELDEAFKLSYDAHRDVREIMNDRTLQKEVAAKTMLAFTEHVKNGGDVGEFDYTQHAPNLPSLADLEVRRNIAQRARAAALKEFWAEFKEYGYGTWFDKALKPVLDKKITYTENDTWQFATVKKKRRERDQLEPVLRQVNLRVAQKTILKGVHPQTPGIEKTLRNETWDAREALSEHTYDEDRFEKQVPMHKLRLEEVPGG